MRLRYLSLFSGIEAASVAWGPLGWMPVAFAEVSSFACAALSYHYPQVPNLGDITRITEWQIQDLGHIDVVVFGPPCQDLSVAGKRAGLKGERSGLFFDAMRIVRWSGARYALFENVPGLFSSNDGRDFAAVVGAMAGMELDVPPDGWRNTGVALGRNGLIEWAVLDAQWFGVPLRRRRIFALRDIGDWRNRPPLLFIPESLRGYPAPSREAGKDIAGTIEARARTGGYDPGPDGAASNQLVAMCLNGNGGSGRIDGKSETFIAHSLRAECFDAGEDGTGRGIPLAPMGFNNTGQGWWNQSSIASGLRDMNAGSGSKEATLVAFSCKDVGDTAPMLRSMGFDKSHRTSKSGGQGSAVRRLTPL